MREIIIYGAGGFGREVMASLSSFGGMKSNRSFYFMVDDEFYQSDKVDGYPVIKFSEFNGEGRVLIAVGDPVLRMSMYCDLTKKFPSSQLYDFEAYTSTLFSPLSEGSIACEGSVITTNVYMGLCNIFNLHSSVGHDCVLGSFVTLCPGARVSGNCKIGYMVYIGTNASIREGISICSDVTIGAGGVVVKDIDEPGVYVGNPVRKIK